MKVPSLLLAFLLTAPDAATFAVAQQPNPYLADQYLPDQYNVVVRGQIVGADPDAQIRSQLSREWDFRYGE